MNALRTPEDLAAFFEPRSVAVIGASRDPAKVGGGVVANLRAAGFEGRVWPVVQEAATRMRNAKIGCLPVVSEGKLVGIITGHDLLRLVEPM